MNNVHPMNIDYARHSCFGGLSLQQLLAEWVNVQGQFEEQEAQVALLEMYESASLADAKTVLSRLQTAKEMLVEELNGRMSDHFKVTTEELYK